MAKIRKIETLKPRTTTLALADGDEVQLTLNFGLLRKIGRKLDEEAYATVCAVCAGKSGNPTLEQVYDIIWAAYLCGCLITGEEPMDKDDFWMLAGDDITAVIIAFRELINPNNRTLSAERSETKSGGASEAAGEE